MDELNDTLELSQRSTVAKEDSVNSRSWSYRRSRLANPYDLEESYSPSIQDSLPRHKTRLQSNAQVDDESQPLLHSNAGSAQSGSVKSAGTYGTQKHVHFPEGLLTNQPKERQSEIPYKDYDSLDYDICYNVPYKEMVRKYSSWTYVHIEVMRWVLVGIIGVLTGIVAFIISIIDIYLTSFKLHIFETTHASENGLIHGFLALLFLNILFSILASLFVVIEPVAAGSGIREVRCYLNGIKVLRVTRALTFFAKTVGVLLSIAAGLFVGKEGPMIHSGAIIGVGFSQFRSMLLKFKLPYNYFSTDRDKRDFASCGAAAGVAAAFGAPIGGVMFSLEEGSSFWNQALTWRTLFMSLYNGEEFGFLRLGSPGLVNFGTFGTDESKLWNAYHLIIFMLMGAVGGLLGALFNHFNINLTKYRMKHLHRRHRIWRVPEAILIAMVTTVCIYLATVTLGTCVQIPCDAASCANDQFRNETRAYWCPGDDYFNDMGTLIFNSQEKIIRQLFHLNGAFSLPTLWIFFLMRISITCWTYGAGISGGAFTPSLVIGATFGRFLVNIFGYLSVWQPEVFGFLTNIYPGIYALVGAVSFLGGVKRMIISFTVILIECTNETSLALPVLLSLMMAKLVGDRFSVGLNNRQIALREVPFLGWESPEQMDRLSASDVMSADNLCYVYPITRIESLERLLKTTAYSAFLVVTPVEAEQAPERPKRVHDVHTPLLYRRPSIRKFTDGSETESGHSSSSRLFVTGVGLDAHMRINSTPTREISGSVVVTHDPALSWKKGERDESVSSRDTPKKLLMFHGIILRSQLTVLLKHKVYFDENDGLLMTACGCDFLEKLQRPPETQKVLSHSVLTASYPRFPDAFDAMRDYTEAERSMLMDLSLYMNSCPYTISHEALLPQVFNLFRTMGLRHLPVIQEPGLVVGIITRHDLTQANLREKYLQKKKERRKNK